MFFILFLSSIFYIIQTDILYKKSKKRRGNMDKKAFFFIDDVIWCFRDIAKNRPESIFDQPFLKLLKKAHDEYGTKVQLNLF